MRPPRQAGARCAKCAHVPHQMDPLLQLKGGKETCEKEASATRQNVSNGALARSPGAFTGRGQGPRGGGLQRPALWVPACQNKKACRALQSPASCTNSGLLVWAAACSCLAQSAESIRCLGGHVGRELVALLGRAAGPGPEELCGGREQESGRPDKPAPRVPGAGGAGRGGAGRGGAGRGGAGGTPLQVQPAVWPE